MVTEFERLKALAIQRGWEQPPPMDSIVPWFKYWKAKESGQEVSPPAPVHEPASIWDT